MASKFEEPVADKKKKKNSSFVTGDAVMPKWAQKTVTLPPHTRGCHLVTPLVRMLYFLHFQRHLWLFYFLGRGFLKGACRLCQCYLILNQASLCS